MANLPLIELVKRQALLTFSKYSSGVSNSFEENFSKLWGLVNSVTIEDVDLHPDLLHEGLESHSPVSYIDVLEDPSLTIGIFVLKQGAKLPLHDHPLMYGILKVIYGTVQMQSYSIITGSEHEQMPKGEVSEVIPSDISLSKDTLHSQITLLAKKEPPVTISSTDSACVLSPLKGNIHEIYGVHGPAAFLDVLSPPYHTDIPGIGSRPCRYFKEIDEDEGLVDKDKNSIKKLLRIPFPGH